MLKEKAKSKARNLEKHEESDYENLNREIIDRMERIKEEERRRKRETEIKMKEKNDRYEEKRASVLERKRFLDMLHENEAMNAKRDIEKKYGAVQL